MRSEILLRDATEGEARRSPGRGLAWLPWLLIVVPLALAILKGWPRADAHGLEGFLSFASVPPDLQDRVRYVLFLPLGAVVVVFFRVTLGLRVLGPFRSILLAIAFQLTGILPGIAFLVLIVGTVVAARPLIRSLRLPYFGRVSVTLSLVAAAILLMVRTSVSVGMESMLRVAYFPVIVLVLIADGFARTWRREGRASALWRGLFTVIAAVIITGLSEIPRFAEILLGYPELLVAEIGMVILISHHLGFRWFEKLNPAPVRPRKRRRRASRGRGPAEDRGKRPSTRRDLAAVEDAP